MRDEHTNDQSMAYNPSAPVAWQYRYNTSEGPSEWQPCNEDAAATMRTARYAGHYQVRDLHDHALLAEDHILVGPGVVRFGRKIATFSRTTISAAKHLALRLHQEYPENVQATDSEHHHADLLDALIDLRAQVLAFAEMHGEASFETGRAERAIEKARRGARPNMSHAAAYELNPPGTFDGARAIPAVIHDSKTTVSVERDAWHEAVLDACIVRESCYLPNNPRKTVQQLLAWEADCALDPAVSERARVLIDAAMKPSPRDLALIALIEAACTGRYEWRAMNGEESGYCIAFDSERDAQTWIDDYRARHPDWLAQNGYHIVKQLICTEAERLAKAAAARLRTLSCRPTAAGTTARYEGHSSLADMISTHVCSFRTLISHSQLAPDIDPTYVAHELAALADIAAACDVDLANEASPAAVAAPDLYFYGDHEHGFECPDDAAIVAGRNVGERYTLRAAWYADVVFEVTKVPDSIDSDYAVIEVPASADTSLTPENAF